MVTALAIGGAELLAMILLSVYGAVKLPPDARVPMHWAGAAGNFAVKRTGLIAWPVIGALIFALLASVSALIPAHGKSGGITPLIFMPIVLCVILLGQIVAIDKARRVAGADPAQ